MSSSKQQDFQQMHAQNLELRLKNFEYEIDKKLRSKFHNEFESLKKDLKAEMKIEFEEFKDNEQVFFFGELGLGI